MRSRLDKLLDRVFRALCLWNGLCCMGVVGRLEFDAAYPLGRGALLAFGFLAMAVVCAWLGNWYTEWLGNRPQRGKSQ